MLGVMVLALSAVALLLGVGGGWLIKHVAEETGDRVLAASARAIAETLVVDHGEVALDLPPFALGMLESSERDNVYYDIRQGRELLSGYLDLPTPPSRALSTERTTFRYVPYRSTTVRVATEVRRLPGIEELIIVQVAETLEARHAVAKSLLVGLILLEALFVTAAAALVWPVVRWSVRPLTHLRQQIQSRRAPADFSRLDESPVPNELRGVVRAFNGLLEILEQGVQRMRHFTADASHQMRTPLAVLRTHIAVLRRVGTSGAAGRQSLEDIENAALRLQRLLTQLLAMARAEATESGRLERTDVREVLAGIMVEARQKAQRDDVSIHLNAQMRPFWARTEPILAAELLSNLLDNAIRYNRPQGTVEIRLFEAVNGVYVEIEDDGPGIPVPERENVFQRFNRLPRDQHHHGSGLGLSIVRALALNLRTQIELSAGTGGVGLKVTVRFPGPGY
jgi:two-component system sensor histidine kinase TctE